MTSNENEFDFKGWLEECSFTEKEAAHYLQMPIHLVRLHLKNKATYLTTERRLICEELLKQKKTQRKKEKQAQWLDNSKRPADYQKALDDLLLCLNSNKNTNNFWPVTDKVMMQNINPYLLGDVHGIQTVSKIVQIKFEENKFQPYEKTQAETISLFYVIEFLPFDDNGRRWGDDDFREYSLSTSYFKDRKKKLAERSIVYLFSNSIDTIVEKVLNDGEVND